MNELKSYNGDQSDELKLLSAEQYVDHLFKKF